MIMDNNINGYVIKLVNNPAFLEYKNMIVSNNKHSFSISSRFIDMQCFCINVSLSLFGLLAMSELLESDNPFSNVFIYEVTDICLTDKQLEEDRLYFNVVTALTKTNEITYETFYNYIISNASELIEWVRDIIKYNYENTGNDFNVDILIIFMNLYKMNICREYIKDITSTMKGEYKDKLRYFISVCDNGL